MQSEEKDNSGHNSVLESVGTGAPTIKVVIKEIVRGSDEGKGNNLSIPKSKQKPKSPTSSRKSRLSNTLSFLLSVYLHSVLLECILTSNHMKCQARPESFFTQGKFIYRMFLNNLNQGKSWKLK